MSLPAYPKYKPSGVEWLGDIPDGWGAAPLRLLSQRYSGGTPDKSVSSYWENGSIPWLNSGTVNQETITKPSALISMEGFSNSSAKWIPKGAIVVALAGQGKTKGMAGYIGFETTCNQSMAAIVFDRANSRFMFWWLKSQYRNIRGLSSDEGRDGLNLEMVGSIPCPVPPRMEQQSIADYLDTKTGQIDELIGKKKELIEKLKEQRTALITHAVTKGIKAEGGRLKMKHSGVEWLGDIPEHWEVRRLKFLASEPLKYGANEAAELEDRDLPRFIRITDVNEDGSLKDESFRSLPIKIAEPFLLDDGDILLARSGATVGKSFLYSTDWGISAFAGYLIRFRVDKTNFNSRFAKYCLMSKGYWAWIQSSLIQATIQNVSAEKYANLVLPLPSVIEQENITCYLDKKTGLIDKLIFRTETAILKLEEYRTAVITAVVTGKVRVSDMDVGYSSFEQEPLLAAEEMGGYGIE